MGFKSAFKGLKDSYDFKRCKGTTQRLIPNLQMEAGCQFYMLVLICQAAARHKTECPPNVSYDVMEGELHCARWRNALKYFKRLYTPCVRGLPGSLLETCCADCSKCWCCTLK